MLVSLGSVSLWVIHRLLSVDLLPLRLRFLIAVSAGIVRMDNEKGVYPIARQHALVSFYPNFLSLLSDSNQRPRDYKSRALAN